MVDRSDNSVVFFSGGYPVVLYISGARVAESNTSLNLEKANLKEKEQLMVYCLLEQQSRHIYFGAS